MNRLDFAGRCAVVTGGAQGIGAAIAKRLKASGAKVSIWDLDGSPRVDVADPASVDNAARRTLAELGSIDVLVNNAGIAESAPLTRTDRDLWERHLRVNVTGPYLLTAAVLPGMLERRWGRIVNVASLAGLYGAAYVTAYVASKHALVGLTRALALEVAGKGVTVNAVCPGYVATDLTWRSARNIAARTGKSYDEAVAALAGMNPGGRLIDPGEVAARVASVVDDDRITGQALVIDGSGPIPERPPDPAREREEAPQP